MSELPIQKEYEGSICEIKSMANELIAIGKIKEITEKYIKITNSKKELQIVDYGTPLKINVFNSKIGFRVLVASVYTSTRKEMSVDSIYNLVEKERRNFFRVDMNLPAKIVYKESLSDELPIEREVTIMDMSLSGLRFKTNHEIGINKTFSIELTLSKKGASNFSCQILRIIDVKDGIYQYGSEFVYSKTEDADLLCSFLFKKQREFLNNRNIL